MWNVECNSVGIRVYDNDLIFGTPILIVEGNNYS
jgi:hypothetical protein